MNVFQDKPVIVEALHKIAGEKIDVVELGKVEDVRFHQYGSGNVQRLTDFREIVEETGIGEPLVLFEDELLFDFSVDEKFCPDFHIRSPCAVFCGLPFRLSGFCGGKTARAVFENLTPFFFAPPVCAVRARFLVLLYRKKRKM